MRHTHVHTLTGAKSSDSTSAPTMCDSWVAALVWNILAALGSLYHTWLLIKLMPKGLVFSISAALETAAAYPHFAGCLQHGCLGVHHLQTPLTCNPFSQI